jgi:hypothetical protein
VGYCGVRRELETELHMGYRASSRPY